MGSYFKFPKNDRQNNQSFEDQKQAVIHSIRSINKYLECSTQTSFVKCCVIAGSPGSGKSFLLNYVGIYAMSKGLNVVVTSLMARRSIHLGGIHLHKLFFLPVKSMDIHKMAESSLRSLLQNPVSLSILKMIDIILLDEVGQISSELLSCLDLILRKIRSNNIFLGGILFICTLDHKQLQPINGRPFLTSPMVISCFDFVCLKESVRASGDINLQRIQQIARMNPSEYKKNPQLISEFKELISSTCTFVDNWNHEIITPTTYRLYGKKYPARKAIQEYIDQVQSKLSVNEMRIVKSKDMQTPQLSHQEWTQATESTSNGLDQKCKELRTLLFFVGSVFEFTYNNKSFDFTQAQLGLMLDLPSQNDVDNFRKIPIMVAPAGIKVIEFDPEKSKADYENEGWVQKYVGESPTRTYSLKNAMRGQRRQYGLKHHVTSTVHACMGDTLHKIVTEISNEQNELKLWDKAQAIVLLSRTSLGSNIIFVGDKK